MLKEKEEGGEKGRKEGREGGKEEGREGRRKGGKTKGNLITSPVVTHLMLLSVYCVPCTQAKCLA